MLLALLAESALNYMESFKLKDEYVFGVVLFIFRCLLCFVMLAVADLCVCPLVLFHVLSFLVLLSSARSIVVSVCVPIAACGCSVGAWCDIYVSFFKLLCLCYIYVYMFVRIHIPF